MIDDDKPKVNDDDPRPAMPPLPQKIEPAPDTVGWEAWCAEAETLPYAEIKNATPRAIQLFAKLSVLMLDNQTSGIQSPVLVYRKHVVQFKLLADALTETRGNYSQETRDYVFTLTQAAILSHVIAKRVAR